MKCLPVSDDHYLNMSARAMKQILIDYARAHSKAFESGAAELSLPGPPSDVETSLAVRQVFLRLKRHDPTAAEVLRLRFVEDLTVKEVSQRLKCTTWSVRRDEEFALQWMAGKLSHYS